jgi:hypothetical protein
MNDIVSAGQQALKVFSNVEEAEKAMLQLPQVDCPVVHHFGPNLCIREVFMPKGTMAVGHKQKFKHMNVLLKGKVMMLNEDGSTKILEAPFIFEGQAGRKIGYVLEDMVWQNIYSTDLQDSNDVEEFFIEKSENWQSDQSIKLSIQKVAKEADRNDYLKLLKECGIPHEIARKQSENEEDQISIFSNIVRVADSAIEGQGLFLTSPVKAGNVICQARIKGKRTQAGRFTNHSVFPNAKMVLLSNSDIDLVAISDINGCKGGSLGEEITIDYRQALSLSGINFKGNVSCQE